MLIILGGLPGAGKTTIARELARRLGAVHIRIDSIEQAIRDSGVTVASLDDAGYRAGYAVAEDNLRIGRTVVADSVNPIAITRDAWVEAANRARVERDYHSWERDHIVIDTADQTIEHSVDTLLAMLPPRR